jgi:hypothetical protein
LNDLYEGGSDVHPCPVLTVPADNLDYVAHNSHLGLVVSKIRQLSGKEESRLRREDVAG